MAESPKSPSPSPRSVGGSLGRHGTHDSPKGFPSFLISTLAEKERKRKRKKEERKSERDLGRRRQYRCSYSAPAFSFLAFCPLAGLAILARLPVCPLTSRDKLYNSILIKSVRGLS